MMAVDILKTTMTDKLPTDLEGMEASMERLLALIDDVYKYVDNVDVRIKTKTFFNQSCLVFSNVIMDLVFRKDVLHQITVWGDFYGML